MKLSIITPNYNYATFISKTIESVIEQDYTNIEHIIVDDGSTDVSVELIQKYVEKFPNKVHLIKQENSGQTPAINRALSCVSGDIVGWINSDDYYCPNVFSKIVDEFKKDEFLDAIFGDINIVDLDGNLIRVNRYLPFDYASGVFNGFGKIIPSNAIFWRKKLTESVGLMKNDFQYAMDSEYWSRLLFQRKVKHIPLVIAAFRWHANAKTIKRRDVESFAFSKAKMEDAYVFTNSYNKLKLSKLIPFHLTFILKVWYKVKRLSLRFLMGHYA